MRPFVAAIGLVVLGAPGEGWAQVVQSYSYDANGRLTGVTTSGSAGTHTSAYAYDAADNRISRSQTGASTWVSMSRLPADQFLQPDEALFSPDGRYSFALRSSGQLELWFGDEPAEADLQPIVTAFIVTGEGQARFEATLTANPADTWLALRDDGTLVLTDAADQQLWLSSGINIGKVTQRAAGETAR